MDDTKLSWHVYLLTCADGTLYCGVTNDLERRLAEHNAGTGAKYTRTRLPVTLTASAPFADRSAAQTAEAAVKRRPRARKVDFLLALAAAPRFGQADPGAGAAPAPKAKARNKPKAPETPEQPAPGAGTGQPAPRAATASAQAPESGAPESPAAKAAPKARTRGRKKPADTAPEAAAKAPAQPAPAPGTPESGAPEAASPAKAAPAPKAKAKTRNKPRAPEAEAAAPRPAACPPPLDLLDRRLAPRRTAPDVEPLRGKITKEDISLLPLGAWCGDIVIVDTPRAAEAAARDMRAETVLGFDTESRPAFMKGRYYLPSLIQMATTETVYIYMLGRLAFPESLVSIFEDPRILKTGVAVRDDVKDLQRITPFAARGFIDLGVIALYHKLDTHGLRNLAAKFLGIRISKAARCTNWANPRLTPAQINYAATDAWISRELFLAMDREGLIEPARDYDNGNGAAQAKDSKSRARARRGGRSRRR
ncbi:GIY-YIG nuclease family protein [Desulfocurvus sp.]|uniref:GIY-YIG nuclease family protein n=1 Tax=Desulfocurvus sp. TaxID=2871698 RepID=UPI0034267954